MATPGGQVVGRVIAAVCQSGVVDDQVAVLEAASAVFVSTTILEPGPMDPHDNLRHSGLWLELFRLRHAGSKPARDPAA